MTDTRYVIVTPVRNEAGFVGRTIESVRTQTVLPLQWVFVDDGSTDGTPELLQDAARRDGWITLVRRSDRGYRLRGVGVAESFREGLSAVTAEGYGFIVKLDADVAFGPRYFARLFDAFAAEEDLGISSGNGYERRGRRLRPILQSSDTVFGATRVYRARCYEEIGGVVRSWGWDAIDEAKARQAGWRVRVVEDVPFEHLKVQTLKNKLEHGRSAYAMSSHPAYVLARGLWRVKEWPYVLGGLAILAGYITAPLIGTERVGDREYVRTLRSWQLSRLRAALSVRRVVEGPRTIGGDS